MGRLNSEDEKDGVWLEGRVSKEHIHKDGTRGQETSKRSK